MNALLAKEILRYRVALSKLRT